MKDQATNAALPALDLLQFKNNLLVEPSQLVGSSNIGWHLDGSTLAIPLPRNDVHGVFVGLHPGRLPNCPCQLGVDRADQRQNICHLDGVNASFEDEYSW